MPEIVDQVIVESGGIVRCFRCSKFVGESAHRIELAGLVRTKDLVGAVAKPRSTWKCKCGWTNIYEPAER
jgi:hypothetical protein